MRVGVYLFVRLHDNYFVGGVVIVLSGVFSGGVKLGMVAMAGFRCQVYGTRAVLSLLVDANCV